MSGRTGGGLRTPKNAPALLFGDYKLVEKIDVSPCNYFTDKRWHVQPIDLNDQIGDCAPVGWANLSGLFSAVLTGTEFNATIDQILALYKTQNPDFDINGTADTNGPGSSADGGMDLQTLLEYLLAHPVKGAPKIVAFAKVDHTDLNELREAISLAGGLLLGIVVTDTQEQEFPGDFTYDANGANPGGHCTAAGGWAEDGIIEATWADTNKLLSAFVTNALQEAWLVITDDHLVSTTFVKGMDMKAFVADLATITEGKIQLTDPTPDPNPVDPTPVDPPDPEPTPDPTPDPEPTPDPDPVPDPDPTPDPTPGPVPAPSDPPTAQITTVINDPTTGATLNDGDVTVSGTVTGDEGGAVTVYDGQNAVSTDVAITDNTWQSAVTLTEGTHELWAAYVDSNGNEGEPSAVVDVTVDTQPDPVDPPPSEDVPDAPVITYPEESSSYDGGALVIRGSSTGNGDTVLVYDAGEDASVDATLVSVNPVPVNDGAWSLETSLEPGTHNIYATERNSFGNVSDPSATVTFEIQEVPEPPSTDAPDERLAHYLRHGLLKHGGRHFGWAERADLIVHAEEWLEAKNL